MHAFHCKNQPDDSIITIRLMLCNCLWWREGRIICFCLVLFKCRQSMVFVLDCWLTKCPALWMSWFSTAWACSRSVFFYVMVTCNQRRRTAKTEKFGKVEKGSHFFSFFSVFFFFSLNSCIGLETSSPVCLGRFGYLGLKWWVVLERTFISH